MDEVHKAISEAFITNYSKFRNDNMPILVRKGTRDTLARLFGKLNFNRGVEVGTRKGAYARTLCKANPNLLLSCVDPWVPIGMLNRDIQEKHYAATLKNLEPYNVTVIRKKSMEALKDFKDHSLDFVFIDGAHDFDNVCADLIFWSYKVHPGGIVAAHDYIASHWSGVMKAIDGYTHSHRIEPWFVTREQLTTAFWVKPRREGPRP